MTVTWSEAKSPPTHARGLPNEVHFWKCQGTIYILRDTDDPTMPTWCAWHPGVAIKDVGLKYVTAEGRRCG